MISMISWKNKIFNVSTAIVLIFSFIGIVCAQESYFEPPMPKASRISPLSYASKGDFFGISLFTGAATHVYSIEVPPGLNKLTPSLDLSYDSSTVRGKADWCGLGWDLNLSYIQRDVNYTPENLNDDKFDLILNGSKYDLVYISGEGRYHTKAESHLWIEKLTDSPNQKGEYWIIRDRQGKEYRFGYNLDSENMASTRDYVWRWSLDQIKDTNDNKIFFSYQENPKPNDIGAVYISQIKYNNERKRIINFILEDSDKPDAYIYYDQGTKIRKTRRLKEIDILIDSNRVRKYLLNYSLSSCSKRSLLDSITQYGSDGTSSLPPTKFTYQEKDFGFKPEISWTNPGWLRHGDEVKITSDTFDMNRDGFPDYIKTSGGSDWKTLFNNSTGFSPETNWSAFGHRVHSSEYFNRYNTFDINGDGLPDLVDASGSTNWNIHFNNGSGFDSAITWSAPERWISYNTEDAESFTVYDTFDINGDGLPDFVRKSNGNWQVYLNTGNGFSQAQTWPGIGDYIRFNITEGSSERFTVYDTFDINGDGLPDFVNTNWTTNWNVYLNNGSGFDSAINWPAPYNAISYAEGQGGEYLVYWSVFDINGDNLPDYVRKFMNNNWQVYLNTGSGFSSALNWSEDTGSNAIQIGEFFAGWDRVIDLNGDGAVDFVRSGNGWHVYTNKMSAVDLLTKVTTSQGGIINIDYAVSTQYDNTGQDDVSDLGFAYWCVSSTTKNNGMSGAHHAASTYTYEYANGLYDYEEKEFRGFGYVKLTDSTGDYTEYYFHQDDALKGKNYKIENKDSQGTIYSKTEYSWDYQTLFTAPEMVYFTYLNQENNYSYDGDSQNPKIARIQYRVNAFFS